MVGGGGGNRTRVEGSCRAARCVCAVALVPLPQLRGHASVRRIFTIDLIPPGWLSKGTRRILMMTNDVETSGKLAGDCYAESVEWEEGRHCRDAGETDEERAGEADCDGATESGSAHGTSLPCAERRIRTVSRRRYE
jgi:hypothetical protein